MKTNTNFTYIYKGENDIAAGRVHSTGDVRDAVAAELGL